MRNDHTDGLYHLNPIDVCACIMLTSYYMNEKSSNVALFAATDKLNKFELNIAEPDLNAIETIFQGVWITFFLLLKIHFVLFIKF